MTKFLKKPLSVLLAALMIVSLFAIVPLSASATSSYYDLARGTLIQPNDIFSFEDIGSFKFADYDDPTIIHEVKGSDFSYNKATLSVTDGYYSFGSTKLLPTSVSPGGLLIADYDSTTKMATFGVQNITHSFDETTGTLTIGGSGVVPEHYAMTGTGASGVVFTQSNLVKHLIIDATDMIAIQNSAFMAYNGGCVLEDVKINSTSSTPLIIEEQAVFYRSGNTVTVTVNAMKLATVTNSPVKNYSTPVNLIYNIEQPITFKKNALTDPSRYLTVTFPTHCNILIPGGAQFTDSQLQEEYDSLAEDGYEEFFWRMHSDLVEGTDYVLGDARYEELTPLNASLVVGNKNTALFSAYTITDESVNGTVTASVNGTDVTEAAADADVLLTVAPAEGYQFVSISSGDVSLTTVTEGSQYSFTMPAKNITVKAEFEAIPTHTVTWKNEDGTTIDTTSVYEGTTPTYNGTTPEKTSDKYYDYTFSGWSPAIAPVSADVTYTAQFTATAKTFKVSVKKLTGGTYTIENLTGETTVSQLKEIIADQIDIPATAQRLIFAGKELEDAKTLAEYNIEKESTIHLITRGYTVTWLNYDNSELGTTTVQYGVTPSYDGETPTKPEDEQNTYTFAGWTPEITAVTGDATYKATYTATAKTKDLFPQHSITLGGNIGVNFYIDSAAANFASASEATVKFTCDGKAAGEVDLKGQTPDANGYYKATCDVVAAQMAHKIHAEVYLNGEKLDQTDDYSVQDYAETVYANPEKYDSAKPNELKSLVLSLLNYGAMAQTVFDSSLKEHPALANATVGDNGYEYVTADMIAAAIKDEASDLNEVATQLGAKYYTNSLIYLSKNTLRIYFTPTSYPGEIPNAGAYDGNLSGYYYYVDHENIPAAELDDQQTFTVGGTTFTFSALDYAKAVVESTKMEPDQQNLAKALYLYNQTANDYFDAAPAPVENVVDLSTLTANYEAQDGDVLTGILSGDKQITIADGATVTLKDVNITCLSNNEETANFAGITPLGDATIMLEGANTVKGGYEDYPGIYVPENTTLTIDGTGSLDASSNGYGCGIGGGFDMAAGNIVINGGTIIANGGDDAAGIGSGAYESSCGDITINGGTVTATGGGDGAGIGSGAYDSLCGDITINGGTVTATGGGDGAGIGSGAYGSSCGTKTIAPGANVTQN